MFDRVFVVVIPIVDVVEAVGDDKGAVVLLVVVEDEMVVGVVALAVDADADIALIVVLTR